MRNAPHPPRTTRAAEIRRLAVQAQKQQEHQDAEAQQQHQQDGSFASLTTVPFASSMAAAASRGGSVGGAGRNTMMGRAGSATAAGPASPATVTQQTTLQLQSFETILKMMDNPGTAEQFDRHASQLASLLPHLLSKASIPARLVDPSSPMGGLASLIRKVAEAVSANEAAVVLDQALSQLLTLAALPIQCSTLHDQRALPGCVMALLDAVSLALQEPHTLQTRTQAATVMRDVIRRVNDKCGVDVRATSNSNGAGGASSSTKKKKGTSGGRDAAGAAGNTNNVTTGSAIRDLRAAVTKQCVLALSDAWRASIHRDFDSTVAFARANSLKAEQLREGAISQQSDYADQSGATNGGNTSSNPDVTVDGINRQLAHRDHSLEVIAVLQALTAATSVRSRARWLVTATPSSSAGDNSGRVDLDELFISTLALADGDPRTALCVELVWNLLQLCPAESSFLASRKSYDVLLQTLRFTVNEGHIAARRELRNDILVVFGMLSDVAPDSHCVETALVDLVLELACGVELGLEMTARERTFKQHHTTRTEDLQLKLLAWDLLRRWCVADQGLAEYAFSCKLFDSLLCYIDVACENTAVVAWSTPQLLELQEHALRVLEDLVRVGCAWFCAARGPAICVSYVLECPARPASLLQHAISLLAEAAASPARKLVAGCGALPLALRLLSSVAISRETIDRHVNCLTLVADLVDRTPEYQHEFANNSGVEVLMPMLQAAVDLADLGDDELMLAAVDCIWACVLGCQQNEDRFLELGGVGALLSLLDMRKILQDDRETKAKTLGAQAVATGHTNKKQQSQSQHSTTSPTVSLLQKKQKQMQNGDDNEQQVDEDEVNSEGDDCADDPVADCDDHANFPLACLADVLIIPGASDFARRWRSPRTGRSGVQVLLSLWKMASVPADIIRQGAISARTASKFDVGCAVLGKASREPLPIGEEEQDVQRAENKKRNKKQRQQERNHRDRYDDDDDDDEGDGDQHEDDDDVCDDDSTDADVVSTIPTRETDPSFVSRAGIVVAARDVRSLATEYRKNFKVYAALCFIGYNGHHELELEERASLTTIQQFMSLCKDEVWETVSNSLLSAGVEPTAADWETLRLLREAAEQRASGLQATRAAFTEMQRRQREAAEKTFYEALIKRTEERLGGGGPPGSSKINENDMKRRSSKFLNSELKHQQSKKVRMADGTSGGESGPEDGEPRGLASNLSITEAKMRNKQMLKSSFVRPVRKTAPLEEEEQQKQQQQQHHDGDEHEGIDDVSAVRNALMAHQQQGGGGGGGDQHQHENDSVEGEEAGGAPGGSFQPNRRGTKNPSDSVALERWGAGKSSMTDDEFAVFKAINSLRLNPQSFVPVFEAALKRFDPETGHIQPDPQTNDDAISCEEGRACIQEAIDFISSVRPLAILLDVPMGMMLASRDFSKRAATRLDRVTDSDGDEDTPEARLKRYGKLEQGSKTMQLLSTGCFTPEAVVLQLVLGDGDPSRPERDALFNPAFKCFSTAVTDHPVYKRIVQLTLATSYTDNPIQEQRQAHHQMWSDL